MHLDTLCAGMVVVAQKLNRISRLQRPSVGTPWSCVLQEFGTVGPPKRAPHTCTSSCSPPSQGTAWGRAAETGLHHPDRPEEGDMHMGLGDGGVKSAGLQAHGYR